MMSFYPLTSKTQNVNKIKTFDSHQSMYCKMWGVRNTVEKVDFLDVMTSHNFFPSLMNLSVNILQKQKSRI